jgi:hypothetical protein
VGAEALGLGLSEMIRGWKGLGEEIYTLVLSRLARPDLKLVQLLLHPLRSLGAIRVCVAETRHAFHLAFIDSDL